jgi:L-seryl-tRNA(Ser) seleniumtransferase
MAKKQALLSSLPSVDEVIKGHYGIEWLKKHPRVYVLKAIREVIDLRRRGLLSGATTDASPDGIYPDIEIKLLHLSSLSLKPVINATGVVIHTNLGRAALSDKAIENVIRVAAGYSNLEYDLKAGTRGERHSHIKNLLCETTGAEDGIAVNNNAAAVLVCLNTLAKGREVIVSRGELVEIGGSFRVPDVMAGSGAILTEVGTTNKTHIRDYEKAINDNTALILKVHKSNFRIQGFTEEVSLERLAALGRERNIPVMYDLGSGCLINLKAYGIYSEPEVKEIVKSGVDLVTFSGDKLLGGPQAGLIAGRKELIEKIRKNPLSRALRIDKLTLAALEATLLEYADVEKAVEENPTLNMLLQGLEVIKRRAKKITALLKLNTKNAAVVVIQDSSQAGGGALPGKEFPTYAVSIKPENISVNELEERLRKGAVPVIARIKEGCLLLDARTIKNRELAVLVSGVKAALG